jgi:hypothetical protein
MAAGRSQFRGVIRAVNDRAIADGTRAQAATLRTPGVSKQNTRTVNRQATYEHERRAQGSRSAGQTGTPDLGAAQARRLRVPQCWFSARVVNARRGARLCCRVLVGRDNGKSADRNRRSR